MTIPDLVRIARELVLPEGSTLVVGTVEQTPCARLSDGSPSGLGGVTTFRAAALVDGRRRVPVGPAFARAADALALIDLLNGSTPRPGPGSAPAEDRPPVGDADPDPGQGGAPIPDGALPAGATASPAPAGQQLTFLPI